jgi:hypothetical protein
MARITSVMAGLACLALMCFAVPIASAAPTDHLMFDSGPGYELVVAPAHDQLADGAAIFEFAAMIAAEAAVDVKTVGCPTVLPVPDDAHAAVMTSSPLLCTSRRYDPGWRAG